MKASEIKALLKDGALKRYSNLYFDIKSETKRFLAAIEAFETTYGEDRDIAIFSVPGRSEIIGNHTDHNGGKVMAGAISRDIIAVASKNDKNVIRFRSEGFAEDSVRLADIASPKNFKNFTSRALVAGMANGFKLRGYEIGGYDAYLTTKVLKGSGLSSSAAFEVMIGNVINHFYMNGSVDNKEIACIAQYSENEYFGKPCGLMDQMACAVGSFVYIDFANKEAPRVEPIEFSLSKAGYALCIVNTGGSHANLNEDYASVPAEMKRAASAMGKDILCGISRDEIISAAKKIRTAAGDRALLRSLHFTDECERVDAARAALSCGDTDGFLASVIASGNSSFKYLQNVYTNKAPEEQGLSLALALSEGYLSGRGGAWRVHGGGFAGTIQAFVKLSDLEGYIALLDGVFGAGAVDVLDIRPIGAAKLF